MRLDRCDRGREGLTGRDGGRPEGDGGLAQRRANGVGERFIRTLKEQVVHGRVHRTLEQVREAVAAFVQRYNEEWGVEKLGFLTPRKAREAWGRRAVA